MKATQGNFDKLARQAAVEARIFFFCGPDESGAFEAAERIVALLREPGERVELTGAELRKDPVRLGDEARSSSLFGDARHILVRAQGDEAHDAVANLLDSEVEPCPVLILATGATDKSRTAKLLADRKDALVGMFYPPDLRAVTQMVRNAGGAAGLQLDDGIAERIARGARLDMRLVRSEIEKLALFLDASPERPRTADRAALDQIGAQSDEEGFGPLVDAVLGGDTRRLSGELQRMRELGLNPVAVLLAFERRTAQLAALAAKLGPRGNVDVFLEHERAARRVFWKEIPSLTIQLRRWQSLRLQRLVEKLAAMHQALLSQSQDAELLLAQGLAEIARSASAKG